MALSLSILCFQFSLLFADVFRYCLYLPLQDALMIDMSCVMDHTLLICYKSQKTLEPLTLYVCDVERRTSDMVHIEDENAGQRPKDIFFQAMMLVKIKNSEQLCLVSSCHVYLIDFTHVKWKVVLKQSFQSNSKALCQCQCHDGNAIVAFCERNQKLSWMSLEAASKSSIIDEVPAALVSTYRADMLCIVPSWSAICVLISCICLVCVGWT